MIVHSCDSRLRYSCSSDMVTRDIRATLPVDVGRAVRICCDEAGLPEAFVVRREICNFKKVSPTTKAFRRVWLARSLATTRQLKIISMRRSAFTSFKLDGTWKGIYVSSVPTSGVLFSMMLAAQTKTGIRSYVKL